MDILELVRSGIQKPSRYLGAEYFPTGYKAPQEGDVRVALVYPDLYEIGMSNTGLRILYSLLRRMDRVYVDMGFTPWPDMEAHLRLTHTLLASRHGNIPLNDFHVVGFSLQHELTYSNVLSTLDLGGIPLFAAERKDGHPLVIAGGPCVMHPEPVAPFFDVIVAGEAEDRLPELVGQVQRQLAEGSPRSTLLKRLDKIPGLYVPSLHETSLDEQTGFLHVPHLTVKRQAVKDLDAYLPFLDFPVPSLETVFDRLSLELARGCQQGCRFCEAGFNYRPPRERDPQRLVQWASDALAMTGLEEVSLASLSTADYSALVPLVRQLDQVVKDRKAALAISSLRAYGVADEVLEIMGQNRSSSLTLAPEAGSQRLRNLINKNVTREQLLEAVGRIVERGWNRLKFYFMLGLPTENDQDLEQLAQLAWDAFALLRGRFRKRAEMVLSFSLFVPRPHTPFQWEPMLDPKELNVRIRKIRDLVRHPAIKVRWHSPDMSTLEAALTRGDRSLAKVIHRAWELGARFDSWEEHLRPEIWQTAFQQHEVSPDRFLGNLPQDRPLPWSHMASHVDDSFLLKERKRASEEASTRPCSPFDGPRICYHCGADCPAPAEQTAETPDLAEMSRRETVTLSRTGTPDWLASRPVPAVKGLSERETQELALGGPTTEETTQPPEGLDDGSATDDDPAESGNVRVWLAYEKVGSAVLLGHLDLLRHFILLFRRAGLPVAYSKGYHPRARFYFPAPLPLGMQGLEEWVEVIFATTPPPDLLERVNRVSFDGLRFTAVRVVEDPQLKISRTTEADYELALSPNSPDAHSLVERLGKQPPEHLIGTPVVAEPHSWWPTGTPGDRVIRLTWGMGQAPRIDKTLKALDPALDFTWVARTRIGFRTPGQDPNPAQ